MAKIAISGRYGDGISLLTGQAVKTKILTDALVKEFEPEQVMTVDTYGWKKHPFRLLIRSLKAFVNSENMIFLPAQSGIKFFAPYYLLINKFFHRRLHYYVVGGWIVDMIQHNSRLLKQLKQIDRIYVEIPSMERNLKELGFQNVVLVGKFRDIIPIKVEAIPQSFEKPYKLCTFSRVMKEKGIEEAVDVVKEVNEYFGYVVYTLDIYGQVDDAYKSRFEEIQKEFPGYIRYCGEVPFSESTATLKQYYFLLFPTYYEGEGYPNTLVDAFAAGLPVIASNWKYNADLINNGVDGYIYDREKDGALFTLLCQLANCSKEIYEMKVNCVKRCTEYIPSNAIRPLIDNLV